MVKEFYLTHGTLSGTTTARQSETGDNDNEGVIFIPKSFRN